MSGSPSPRPAIEHETIGVIDHAEFVLVRLPFVAPFGTSVQTWATKDALLLRLETGGIVAWGECVADPDPFYSPETNESVRSVVKDFLLPMVVADHSLAEVLRSFRRVRGNAMARATVENALVDLIAKRRGVPLHEALGFPRRRIMSGISIGIQESLEALLDAVADAVSCRYHRVKMKIMRGKDAEWVAAVRGRFPNLPLMVDANGDYRLEDADHLRRLDEFGLTMIEQPLGYHDIYQHSLLQPRLATPLCLDESIHDRDDALAALELGACRVINIKQGRVGGLLEAVAMARDCAERGIPVWSGGMDETGIGRAVNIHLQTATGFTLPGDTSETRRYFHEDIVEPPVTLDDDGFIAIPEGPGIGVKVIEDRVSRLAIARERLW